MTETEAIEQARDLARAHGYDLGAYEDPTATRADDNIWRVTFQGRLAWPGNHFMVVLDGRTGQSRLVSGR
jgi:hypothetical protein